MVAMVGRVRGRRTVWAQVVRMVRPPRRFRVVLVARLGAIRILRRSLMVPRVPMVDLFLRRIPFRVAGRVPVAAGVGVRTHPL